MRPAHCPEGRRQLLLASASERDRRGRGVGRGVGEAIAPDEAADCEAWGLAGVDHFQQRAVLPGRLGVHDVFAV